MSHPEFHLEKILNFQRSEKDSLENRYGQSVQFFEEVGKVLYNLLKKKEAVEAKHVKILKNGIQLYELQANQHYMDNLLRQIERAQLKLNHARNQMDDLKTVLLHKSIEVKKYEKLKERSSANFFQETKRLEQVDMDEIATIRASKEIRW
jgi:flagellar FliJ protein